MAQPELRDWRKGECEPVPGKTMPGLRGRRARLRRTCTTGSCRSGPPSARAGIGAHGIALVHRRRLRRAGRARPRRDRGAGRRYPSLATAVEAANVILRLAPETNGELAYRAFEAEEKKVGLPLTDLAEKNRGVRMDFDDLGRQPRRLLNSPMLVRDHRRRPHLLAVHLNVERLVPWRTLTGRQHFYLDHPGYLAFGEQLPTYKPTLRPVLRAGPASRPRRAAARSCSTT